MPDTKSRVEELHGFEVAEGEPDVRGWEVVGRDGQRVGEVAEVLVETGNRSAHYFHVQLDPRDRRPAEGQPEATGSLDPERDSIPELDRLSDDGQVIGHVTVPGDGPPEVPARTIGEALVRDSLLNIENRMTAGAAPGFDRGQGRVLISADRVRLLADQRRLRLE